MQTLTAEHSPTKHPPTEGHRDATGRCVAAGNADAAGLYACDARAAHGYRHHDCEGPPECNANPPLAFVCQSPACPLAICVSLRMEHDDLLVQCANLRNAGHLGEHVALHALDSEHGHADLHGTAETHPSCVDHLWHSVALREHPENHHANCEVHHAMRATRHAPCELHHAEDHRGRHGHHHLVKHVVHLDVSAAYLWRDVRVGSHAKTLAATATLQARLEALWTEVLRWHPAVDGGGGGGAAAAAASGVLLQALKETGLAVAPN
mmetsp:Transcript_122608/g.306214  ORF Transcript_122608/g.306214 Transcript_122608/m.306214 type:complete len:265 (-) Transcript_122608:447-1241(-)